MSKASIDLSIRTLFDNFWNLKLNKVIRNFTRNKWVCFSCQSSTFDLSHILVLTVVTYILTERPNFRLVQTSSCFDVGCCRIDIATNCTNLQNPTSWCPITMNLFHVSLICEQLCPMSGSSILSSSFHLFKGFGVQKSP